METFGADHAHSDDEAVAAAAMVESTGATLDNLPNELMVHVLAFLPCVCARTAALVCRRWEILLADGRRGCCVPANRPRGGTGICDWAAVAGHIHCLRWARTLGREWGARTFSLAAQHGSMVVVAYLCENGCLPNERVCAAAARHGRLDVLTYLHEQGCPWDGRTTMDAETHCHVDCLAYARAAGCPWPEGYRYAKQIVGGGVGHERDREEEDDIGIVERERRMAACLMYIATWKRQPHPLLWMRIITHDLVGAVAVWLRCRFDVPHDYVCVGIRRGRSTIVGMLIDAGVKWTHSCCMMAAVRGHADMIAHAHSTNTMNHRRAPSFAGVFRMPPHVDYASMVLLHAAGCRLGEVLYLSALYQGHIDALDVAHEFTIDGVTWTGAVAAGGRAIVDRAVEMGIAPHVGMVLGAAQRGDLDLVRYLVAAGVGCEPHALDEASRKGHIDVVRYLYEETGWHTQNVADAAVATAHPPLPPPPPKGARAPKRARISAPCAWSDSTMRTVALDGRLDVLAYACERGYQPDYLICRNAAEGGHVACVEYARSRGGHWDARACAAAASGGHLRVLRYLHENGCPWDERTFAAAIGSGHAETIAYVKAHCCPQ